MIKIALDGFGGDNSPHEIVKGAVQAVAKEEGFSIVITGDQEQIQTLLHEYGYMGNRISIYHTTEIIGCDEEPTLAIRRKKDSSLVKGLELLKKGECDGFISAGSTGAVLAGGIFIVGRMQGVKRPCLCPALPTVKGGTVLLADCGANVDCKVEYLEQFSALACGYAKAVNGVENPRVCLLSNGAEDEKGNDLIKEANSVMRANPNFKGNIEARYILSGDCDVVVADGFNGNIALKSAEGTANAVFSLLSQEINSSIRAKLGAGLMLPALKRIKKRMDYTEHGGAAFLGVKKPMVKLHGSTKAKSVCAGILQVKSMIDGDLITQMEKELNKKQDA